MVEKLHFVTGNEGKAKEAQAILEMPVEIVNLELAEIQSLDLEKIVRHKASQAFNLIKKPVIVDDVGLYVVAWSGFPGPFIRFIIDSGGPMLLIKMLGDEANRNAEAVAAIGFSDGNQTLSFLGRLEGQIAETIRGNQGWGWDPIFIPHGRDQTFAEMGPEEKNKISHRRLALEKLKNFLKASSLSSD